MFFNGHKKFLQASEVDSDADSDLQAAIRASMEEADQHALALRQEDALVLAAAAQGLPTTSTPTTPARKRSHSAQVSRSQGRSLTCLLVQQCWSLGWSDLPCCRPSTSRGRSRSGGP